MSLVVAELRRLAKRRFAQVMAALVLLLMAIVIVTAAATHYKPGGAALARAEAEAAAAYADQQAWMERDIQECERYWQSGQQDPFVGWPEDCEEIRQWQPSQEEMVQWFMPPAFEFRTAFPEMNFLLAGLLALFAFVVGASFVGAEWRSGGMTNLLLWRPRRLEVFGAKLAALLGVVSGLTVLLSALWTGAFWLVATYRGITDTMTSGVWQSIGLAELRGLAMVLAAGTAGFALASLGRHTAMAMGVAIGAFVVGVGGVATVAGGMLQVQFWEAWLWPTYIRAWMESSVTLFDWSAPCESFGTNGECIVPSMEISWQVAGVGIAGALVLMLAAAMWHMRQRDVT